MHDFGHAAPVALAGRFEMPNFYGNVGFSTYANRFIEGTINRVALTAYMTGIDAPEFRGLRGQCDQLLGASVGRGRILKSGGETDGSLLHGLTDKRLHAF